jgi:hypothetical protein
MDQIPTNLLPAPVALGMLMLFEELNEISGRYPARQGFQPRNFGSGPSGEIQPIDSIQ